MKENGRLYKITEAHGQTMRVKMLTSHPVYEGHFPGNPITPGVMSLRMIRECAGTMLGKELRYAAVKSCRFLSLIKPGETLDIEMETIADEQGLRLKAKIKDINDGSAKMNLDATMEVMQ